jgi:hypothetical protein
MDARFVVVADAFGAMLSDRVSRRLQTGVAILHQDEADRRAIEQGENEGMAIGPIYMDQPSNNRTRNATTSR